MENIKIINIGDRRIAIKGIGKIEDRIIIILDSEKIISLEETEALNPDDIKKNHRQVNL